jgi:uncharacterized protein
MTMRKWSISAFCLLFLALALPASMPEARGDAAREALAGQLVFNTLHLSSAAGEPSAEEIAGYRRRGSTSHGVGYRGEVVALEAAGQLVWSFQIAFLRDAEAVEAHDQMPDRFLRPYARGVDEATGAAIFVIPEGGWGKQRIWFILRQDRTALNMTIDRNEADADEALAASLPRWHFFVAEARRLGLLEPDRIVSPPAADGDPGAATTALLQAARIGDVEALRRAIAAGAALDAVGGHGATALAWAVSNGHAEAVSVLLAAGADWRLQSVRGQSPLNVAVFQDDLVIIRLLLEAGADVDERITGPEALHHLLGATPLFLAAAHGKEAALAALLAAGATVNATNQEGATALFLAASDAHVPVVRALLEAGAAAGWRDANGASPLVMAADSGAKDEAVVEAILLLVEHFADPNARASALLPPPYGGMTPLAIAAHGGHVAAAAALLLAGADPSLANAAGETVSALARDAGHERITALLTEPEVGASRLLVEILLDAADWGQWSLVDLLILNGIDLNQRDEDGLPLLMRATRHGQAVFVARLLEAGVDVDARDDEEGATALMAAVGLGDPAIVAQFLEARADPNLQAAGGRSGRFAGWTALMIAAHLGDEHMVRVLLEGGADPAIRSKDGLSAVDLARKAGRQAAIDLLENAFRP